jgi:transposase
MRSVADYLTNQTKKLTRRQRTNKANQRLANFLGNHVGELFTFLRYLGADATNWRGERAIRPAVVNRNVWGGNRTEAGALSQSWFMSVMQTYHQRLADPFDFLSRQLTATAPLALPLPIAAQ